MYYEIKGRENREKLEDFLKKEGIPFTKNSDSLTFFVKDETKRLGQETFRLYEWSFSVNHDDDYEKNIREEFPKVMKKLLDKNIPLESRTELLKPLRDYISRYIHDTFRKHMNHKEK